MQHVCICAENQEKRPFISLGRKQSPLKAVARHPYSTRECKVDAAIQKFSSNHAVCSRSETDVRPAEPEVHIINKMDIGFLYETEADVWKLSN